MNHPTQLICPLTATDPAAMRADMDAALALGADAVEWRLDFLRELPGIDRLAALFGEDAERIIATCRPKDEGGGYTGDESRRLELLRRAAELGCLADIEHRVPPKLWPAPESVILSRHDFDGCPDDLDELAKRLDASDAAVNKIAFMATACEDSFRAFDVLRACRKPTIALAMGEAGLTSRILARKFGAFGTFAALAAGAESAPSQPTIDQFRNLYRWDSIGPTTQVYGVIGCPVAHSLSPAIQNAAFSADGLDAVYVPLRIEDGADNFSRFMDALLERPWMDWRGLSVTLPHKENALACVGAARCDELAVRIGAINTITIDGDGGLRGDNTDYAAAIDAMCAAMDIERDGLAGRGIAVLGAGGVARAIVATLAHYGAEVTIYNRTVERGRNLAAEFGCAAAALTAAGASDAEIVINCTSLGMSPKVDVSPLPTIPPSVRVVFDTIYNPLRTRLLRAADEAGCRTVSGLDMFVEQGARQFEIWTGRPAPRDTMRTAAMARLQAGE